MGVINHLVRRLERCLLDAKGKTEPLYETTCVLSYEVGSLMHHAMYLAWGERGELDDNEDGKKTKIYKALYNSELQDVLAQCALLCHRLGLDYEQLTQDGLIKAIQKVGDKG